MIMPKVSISKGFGLFQYWKKMTCYLYFVPVDSILWPKAYKWSGEEPPSLSESLDNSKEVIILSGAEWNEVFRRSSKRSL